MRERVREIVHCSNSSCRREQSVPLGVATDDFLSQIGWQVGETLLCPFCNPDPSGQERLRAIFDRSWREMPS